MTSMKTKWNPFVFIFVEGWEYLLEAQPDHRILVMHHVTPADAGYGQEVVFYLPADYFLTHTVEEFYDDMTAKNISPRSEFIHREQDIEAIRKTILEHDWLRGNVLPAEEENRS